MLMQYLNDFNKIHTAFINRKKFYLSKTSGERLALKKLRFILFIIKFLLSSLLILFFLHFFFFLLFLNICANSFFLFSFVFVGFMMSVCLHYYRSELF